MIYKKKLVESENDAGSKKYDCGLNEWLTQIVMAEIDDMRANPVDGIDFSGLTEEALKQVVSDVVDELAKGRLSGVKKCRKLIIARLCNAKSR